MSEKPHLCEPNPDIFHSLRFRQKINLEMAEAKKEGYEGGEDNDCRGEEAKE